ncbi:MAG: hypothetical protein IT329_05325 [Caldilineaceae bacterium]|nr:hypothetical protein [Caldilineaceae bacterium]
MHRYTVFGLAVESAIELPAARLDPQRGHSPAHDPITHDRIEVMIRVRSGTDAPFPAAAGAMRSITASPAEVTLAWGDVGHFVIRAGREIEIRPRRGVAERLLGLFVTGSAFALLLCQRGMTVLHGSGVALEGQGVGFLGDKGAGKSTLAMGLQQRGARLVADDLLAVAGPGLLALPGFCQMKLWPDALHQLGLSSTALERLRPEVEKRGLPIASQQTPRPVPLRHLFVIQRRAEIEITPLNEKQALLALLPHWYPARFGTDVLQQMQAQTRHFAQCVALARNTRVSLLGRPHALAALPHVMDAVWAYIQADAPEQQPQPAAMGEAKPQ